jgi:hypothetical protein
MGHWLYWSIDFNQLPYAPPLFLAEANNMNRNKYVNQAWHECSHAHLEFFFF